MVRERITWGDVVLADPDDGDLVVGPRSSAHQRLAQVTPLLRARTPHIRDRGNQSTRLRFTVRRQHSSPAAAVQYELQLQATLAAANTAALRRALELDYVVDLTYPTASLASYDISVRGVQTQVQYDFLAAAPAIPGTLS